MSVNYPNMVLNKSKGASASERYLIRKCQGTFLSLWSYANPFTTEKKGKELCDVLAVFENHIFIFSDKFCAFNNESDIRIAWNRWYRHAVEAGVKQILGAERYIRASGRIYLDGKLTQPFPLPITISEKTSIHRIIVARGVREACIRHFNGGNGSLIINTRIIGNQHLCDVDRTGTPIGSERSPLFTIGIVSNRQNYIHVFDDYTLDCVMDELDTVSDFIDYLEQKEQLILSGKDFIADGEEEILGRYVSIIEDDRHCIVKKSEAQSYQLFRFSDFWLRYCQDPNRLIKKEKNRNSYLWDDLLEKAFKCMMDGKLRSMSHQNYESQALLFYRFAKPCRVERRVLADALTDSYVAALQRINIKGPKIRSFVRRISMDSIEDTLITILWLHCPANESIDSFLLFRQHCLEAKILSILPSTRKYTYHIGIAKTLDIERENSEDFIYVNANDFPDDCIEIKEAMAFLTAQSNLLERQAYSVHSAEYSAQTDITGIPYPW